MKILKVFLLAALLGVLVFPLNSLGNEKNYVHYVKVIGVEELLNESKWFGTMKTRIGNDSLTVIAVTENDLLGFDDEDYLYTYKKKDGGLLRFKTDSFRVFLNDKLISVEIGRKNGSYQWLKSFKPEEAINLRFVYIADSLKNEELTNTVKLLKSAPDAILWADNTTGEEIMNAASHIRFNDELKKTTPANAKKIESFYVDQISTDPKYLTGLQQLYIDDFDPDLMVNFTRLPGNFTFLSLYSSKIDNLNFLKKYTQLTELDLTKSRVSDISALKYLTNLKVLSLTGDSIADLSPIYGLKQLRWLALPTNTSSQQLEQICRNLPRLEMIVLTECNNLMSLNALSKLKNLTGLMVFNSAIVPDSLVRFQNLNYLAYKSAEKKDSLAIVKLSGKMPNTMVVPAEPYCMGSGWLLLFVTLLLVSLIIMVIVKKRMQKQD